MSKEIKITDYEFPESSGNLRNLSATWSATPGVSENIFNESRGHTAVATDSCLHSTQRVFKAFSDLLEKTIEFCNESGIAFAESDLTASKNIDSLTNQ